MLITLFRLMRAEPRMAAEHLESYLRLVAAQFTTVRARLQRRLLLQALGWACIGASMLLAGSALMLWGVLPHDLMPMPWLLLLAPGLAAAIGTLVLMACPRASVDDAFASLREEWALDRQMLHELSAAPGAAR